MWWIRNSLVLCAMCCNARLSGFDCKSHSTVAILIPDVLPNDTETEELGGVGGGQERQEVKWQSDRKVPKDMRVKNGTRPTAADSIFPAFKCFNW